MAANVPSISIQRLTENLCMTEQSRDMCLNPVSLEKESGNRLRVDHDAVLRAIITRLENAGESEGILPNDVSNLYLAAGGYVAKMNRVRKFSGKESINPELLPKIKIAAKKLIARIQTASPPVAISFCEDPESTEEICRALRGMTVEVVICGAAHLVAVANDRWLDTRARVLREGHSLRVAGEQDHCFPTFEFHELCGPVFLSACRLSHIFSQREIDENELKTTVAKILRVKKRFPTAESVVDSLIRQATYENSQGSARRLVMALDKTLLEVEVRILVSKLESTLKTLVQDFKTIRDKFAEFMQKKNQKLKELGKSPEMYLKGCENLANAQAALHKIISSACNRAVESCKKTTAACLPYYTQLYDQLIAQKGASTDPCFEFRTAFITGIFEKNGAFSSFLPKRFPKPNELLSFLERSDHPITHNFVDKILEEIAKEEVSSSPSESRSFLPESLRCTSQKQGKKAASAKPVSPLPSGEKQHCSSSGLLQGPSQEKEKAPGIATSFIVNEEEASLCHSLDAVHISAPCPLPPALPAITKEVEEDSKDSSAILELSKASEGGVAAECLDVSPFGFKEGSGPNPTYQYAFHVRRWWDKKFDPFLRDRTYRDKHYSVEMQNDIRFRHTIGLAVIPVIVECGKKFEKREKDGTRLRESYSMFADVQWTDGSKKFERGVITVGYNPQTREFFHLHFALEAPSTLFKKYSEDGYFAADVEEEPSRYVSEAPSHVQTLPNDGSFISRVYEDGVDVKDPKNNVIISMYW